MNISCENILIDPLENLTKEELISEVKKIVEEYREQELQIQKLQHELAQLRRMIFGSKRERFEPANPALQPELPLDIETTAPKPAEKETITYTRNKSGQKAPATHSRQPLPAHLERVVVCIEPTEDVSGLKAIGKEVTEELDYKPGKLFVRRYERTKYARPEDANGNQQIIIGQLPSRPIEKGIPGPGLLARIIIDKYMDHLPCHRQIQRYERENGMRIPASTMSQWLRSAGQLLEPLFSVHKEMVLGQSYLMADETPIKVLDKNKKGATHLGYYWVYHAPLIKMTLYIYEPGRGRDGPQELLKSFKGRLQTDGYAVYDSLKNPNITLLGCMAHARREFDEAKSNDAPRAEYVLGQMQILYQIEREAKEQGLNAAQRFELRQQKSLSVLNPLEHWLKENILQVLPKSPIGKAIAYSLQRWHKLSYYASDGEVEIDNNRVENAIRPVALGRKNYLFAGSHEAAQRAGFYYSLLNTCKWNNIQPWDWLHQTLETIPDHKANRLSDLLPFRHSS